MGLIRDAIDIGRFIAADDKELIAKQLGDEMLERIKYEQRVDAAFDQIFDGIKNLFTA